MPVWADSSHQFSLGAYGSDLNYDGGADGEGYGLYAAAYLDPIKLTDAMPYNLTPFYTRTSGLFFNSSKSRVTDLNQVRGGQVLKKMDGHSSSVSVRLANADLPVWAALNYTRVGSSDYEFTNGSNFTIDHRYIKSATVGWFLNDNLGVYGFFEDDEFNRRGLGAHYLCHLGKVGFVEVGLQYTKVNSDSEILNLEVVNGTVRNANISMNNERSRVASLSYFPTVKAEIGLRYERMDYDHDTYGYSITANASYYILPSLQLGISYHEVFQDDFATRVGKLEYKIVSGSVDFKF
jgi:hypothetical protein